MKAIWYFDVISPYAYLALDDVAYLAKRIDVTYKPVLFAALLKHHGHLGPAEIPSKRIHTYRMCVFEAQRRGMDFRFPPAHPFNSLRALRLLCAVNGDPSAVRRVMDHIWRDGRDPNDDASWATLCGSLGISNPATFSSSDEVKAELRGNTEEAIAAGVFGVPTLVIGGELFWGNDAMPLARAFIDAPEMFKSGEMQRVTGLPDPFASPVRTAHAEEGKRLHN